MNKLGAIILIIIFAATGFWLYNIAASPIIVEQANTANTTIAASGNMTNYPGLGAGLVASPWWLLFAIPVIAVVVIVQRLRNKE